MTRQGCSSKGQTLLWWIVNRKSIRRTIAAAGWWSLEQDLVAGGGLNSWYKTGIRWIGGHCFRTGICWCRKVFAGLGLVVAGICWCRKVVTGPGLVVAGVYWCRKVVAGSGLVVTVAELVAAGAGKWPLVSAGTWRWWLVQECGRWCRTGSCWCRTGKRCCRKVAGARR